MNHKTATVCDTCPWVKANYGKRHPGGWYSVKNLRRLWNGLRTGKAPGMVCHSTDPKNTEYGGQNPQIKPGHEAECGGAIVLIIRNMNALNDKKPQPIQPGLTKGAIGRWVERYFFGGVPEVTCRFNPETEIGVPWMTEETERSEGAVR